MAETSSGLQRALRQDGGEHANAKAASYVAVAFRFALAPQLVDQAFKDNTSVATVAPDAVLMESGMDSLSAVALHGAEAA